MLGGDGNVLRGVGCWGSLTFRWFSGDDHGEFSCRHLRGKGACSTTLISLSSGATGMGRFLAGCGSTSMSVLARLSRAWATDDSVLLLLYMS